LAWLAPLLVGAVPVSPIGSAPNLCKAAPLSAIRQAAGQHYRAGISANGACTWTRADLKAGLTLSTHPRAQGLILMREFLARGARRVAVPGATEAVLVEQAGPAAKSLFVAYPRVVLQLNMSAPSKVPDERLLAVAKLVAGKL
jgi:hypothetical protein